MNDLEKATVRKIARQVIERGKLLDEEILRTAELIASVVRASREFRADLALVQEPLQLLASRQQRLIEARNESVGLHAALKDVVVAIFGDETISGCQRACLPSLWRKTRSDRSGSGVSVALAVSP